MKTLLMPLQRCGVIGVITVSYACTVASAQTPAQKPSTPSVRVEMPEPRRPYPVPKLVIPEDTMTAQRVAERRIAWINRTVMGPTVQRWKAESWGAEAAVFAQAAVPALYRPRWVDEDLLPLVPQAKALLAKAPEDPAVLWLVAGILGESRADLPKALECAGNARKLVRGESIKEKDSESEAVEPAVKPEAPTGSTSGTSAEPTTSVEPEKEEPAPSEASKVKKPKAPQDVAMSILLYEQKMSLERPTLLVWEIRQTRMRFLDAILESLKVEGVWRPEDASDYITLVTRHFTNDPLYVFNVDDVKKMRRAFVAGQWPEWAAKALEGHSYIMAGLKYRGEDRKKAYGKAELSLIRSWQLNPKDPNASIDMLFLAAAAEGTSTPEVWFERALAAQCDDERLWKWAFSMSTRESVFKTLALGMGAIQTRRFDTRIPYFMMEAFNYVQGHYSVTYDQSFLLFRRPEISASLQAMANGYLAQAKSPAEKVHFSWLKAYVSWLGRDQASVTDALQTVGDSAVPVALRPLFIGAHGDVIRMKGEVALTADGYERWLTARDLIGDWKYDEGLAALQSLSDQMHPDVRQMLSRFSAMVRWEQQFHNGEWTRISSELGAWHPVAGQWSRQGDSLVLQGQAQPGRLIYSPRIGSSYEARGEIVIKTEKPEQCVFGVAYAATFGPNSTGSWWNAEVWHNGKNFVAGLPHSWFPEAQGKKVEFNPALPVKWYLKFTDNKLSFKINDNDVYLDHNLKTDRSLSSSQVGKPYGRFGLSMLGSPASGTVSYGPVEVRLIGPAPKPREKAVPSQ